MDVRASCSFRRSLWADAEMLLFVDDEQAEVLEAHGFGEQARGCRSRCRLLPSRHAALWWPRPPWRATKRDNCRTSTGKPSEAVRRRLL